MTENYSPPPANLPPPVPPNQPDQPKPQLWRRRWFLPTATGVAGLIIGTAAAGGGSAATTNTNTAAPVVGPTAAPTTITVTAGDAIPAPPVTETATKTVTAGPTKTVAVKVTPRVVAAFGEGVWNVGEDIRPGRYRTTEAVSDCYWEIDRSPGSDDIVANDNVSGGRPTVILRRGQMFKSERCGDWAKA